MPPAFNLRVYLSICTKTDFAMPAVGGRSQDKIGWLKPSRSGTWRGFIKEVEGNGMKTQHVPF